MKIDKRKYERWYGIMRMLHHQFKGLESDCVRENTRANSRMKCFVDKVRNTAQYRGHVSSTRHHPVQNVIDSLAGVSGL